MNNNDAESVWNLTRTKIYTIYIAQLFFSTSNGFYIIHSGTLIVVGGIAFPLRSAWLAQNFPPLTIKVKINFSLLFFCLFPFCFILLLLCCLFFSFVSFYFFMSYSFQDVLFNSRYWTKFEPHLDLTSFFTALIFFKKFPFNTQYMNMTSVKIVFVDGVEF